MMYERSAWYTEDMWFCFWCRNLREQEGNVPEEHKGKEEDLEYEFAAENWRK